MSEEKLEKYWNKVYYDYLEQEEAKELIDYYKNMEQENKQLKDKINNALNYIKWHYDLGTKKEVSFCLLRDRLLEILGDKENE